MSNETEIEQIPAVPEMEQGGGDAPTEEPKSPTKPTKGKAVPEVCS